jgi:hypothetical protein
VFGDVRVAVAAIRHDGGARSTTRTGRKTENMTAAPSSDPTEIDQMREELDTLRGQLDAERRQRSARTRRAFTWVLTALAVLATVLSLLSVWTLRTLTNTDLFVDRVGSVIEQPAVAQEIGEQAAAQLVEALGLQQRIAEVLPPEAAIAAGPITIAARDFLAEGTTDLVQTEQFRQAWDTALGASHRLAIGILSGEDTTSVTNEDGAIVLNLTPVANALIAQGSEFLSEVLDRDIAAPTLTADTIEDAAAALEQALGVDLPEDFGNITLFASAELEAGQQAFAAMQIATWLTPLIALMLIGLALAVSTRRLRTLLSIVIGAALLLLFVGLALAPLQNEIVGAVDDQGLQGAIRAGFDSVTSSLLTAITVIAVLGVLAALVLFGLGDSRGARASRDALAQSPALAGRHRTAFLGGGALVALILLAIIPGRSWGQFLFVGLLYLGYVLAVLLAPRPPAELPAGGAAGPGPVAA